MYLGICTYLKYEVGSLIKIKGENPIMKTLVLRAKLNFNRNGNSLKQSPQVQDLLLSHMLFPLGNSPPIVKINLT